MKRYLVTIVRTYEVEVDAEDEETAKDNAYDELDGSWHYGCDFDDVDIECLGDCEDE